ncbi:MAG: DUF3822 family protein, partial [Bacteroidota bacterium]
MRTNNEDLSEDFLKLSIQVSLNGLSFCILDTIRHKVLLSDKRVFEGTLSHYGMLKELKALFDKHSFTKKRFSEIVVIHQNPLFGLVPGPLFNPKELPNYLKFNAKLLASDHLDYDEITSHDIVNVYVPFVNVNNYIFDVFGEFVFKHMGSILISSLLNSHNSEKKPVCYVHVADNTVDMVILQQKKLLLYNCFSFTTKEDFL